MNTAERREKLVAVYNEASKCVKCPLSETRNTVVFGAGNADANLMFVGEAPGAEEDVRRARRWPADPAARGDRPEAGGRLHRQRSQVPPSGQPRPAAG
jgi:uracil-DNA glycosylase